MHEDGLFEAVIDPSELRHERIATPLLRDERPEVPCVSSTRITRSRAGSPSRTRSTRERRRDRHACLELPPELAIETTVARRIIVDFIRSQLQQAGFEKLVLGLSGGIDSALVAYLAAEAVGPGGCCAS